MNNIYYNPEKCGLVQFGNLEAGESYEFDTLLVMEETSSKRLFYCCDAGCSCPTPFEDYYFRNGDDNDLTEIRKETLDEFINRVNAHNVSVNERQDLIRAVQKHLER